MVFPITWGITTSKGIYNIWQSLTPNPTQEQSIQVASDLNKSSQHKSNPETIKLKGQLAIKNGVPALEFDNASYTAFVFPKTSDSTALSTFRDIAAPIKSDTYNASSCRPVEFEGQAAVICDGGKTALIYIPKLPQRPFEELDANIMLTAATTHIVKTAAQNISKLFKPEAKPVKKALLSAEEYQQELNHCQKRLQDLEKIYRTQDNLIIIKEYKLSLQNLTENLSDLKAQKSVTAEESQILLIRLMK